MPCLSGDAEVSAPQISFHSGASCFDITGEGQMAASLLQDLIHGAWKILARANLGSDRPDLNQGCASDWLGGLALGSTVSSACTTPPSQGQLSA